MAFGDKPFSVKEIAVAALNADGSYGTKVSLPLARKCTVTPNLVTSKLTGARGATAAVAATLADANLEIDAGGMLWDALAVMTGQSAETNGTTPAQTKTQPQKTGAQMPYFGLIAVADDDDAGDFHLGFPKCKLTTLPAYELAGDEETFLTSALEAIAIGDADGYVMYPVSHETAESADFTTIFS